VVVSPVDRREAIELRGPPCFYTHSTEVSFVVTPPCLMGSVQSGAAIYPAKCDACLAEAFRASSSRKSPQSPGLGGLRSLICSFGSLVSRLEYLALSCSPYWRA
jgi:hypothetical protein